MRQSSRFSLIEVFARYIWEYKEVPKKITRRIWTSKNAKFFDMIGLMRAITALVNLAVHDFVLNHHGMALHPITEMYVWINDFNLKKIKTITYQRAIVPQEATPVKTLYQLWFQTEAVSKCKLSSNIMETRFEKT